LAAHPAYAALLEKVDAFSEGVEAAQAPWIRCERGCDGCCRTRRTAWAVEVAALRAHLDGHPRRDALRDRLSARDVRAGAVCVFLDPDGGCAVYDARPLLCRTHGPALRAEGALA